MATLTSQTSRTLASESVIGDFLHSLSVMGMESRSSVDQMVCGYVCVCGCVHLCGTVL